MASTAYYSIPPSLAKEAMIEAENSRSPNAQYFTTYAGDGFKVCVLCLGIIDKKIHFQQILALIAYGSRAWTSSALQLSAQNFVNQNKNSLLQVKLP